MSRERRLYDTPEWKRVRKAVLARDGNWCQLRCTRKCRGVATTADHIVRPEEGGAPFDLSNLQAACASCNPAKARKLQAVRARRFDQRLQQW